MDHPEADISAEARLSIENVLLEFSYENKGLEQKISYKYMAPTDSYLKKVEGNDAHESLNGISFVKKDIAMEEIFASFNKNKIGSFTIKRDGMDVRHYKGDEVLDGAMDMGSGIKEGESTRTVSEKKPPTGTKMVKISKVDSKYFGVGFNNN